MNIKISDKLIRNIKNGLSLSLLTITLATGISATTEESNDKIYVHNESGKKYTYDKPSESIPLEEPNLGAILIPTAAIAILALSHKSQSKANERKETTNHSK